MLRTQKRVLASEHPGTLTIASILAGSLSYQGRYNAEPMQRELLGGQKRVLGAEHPDTLTSANHLATFLSHQGKHADAERMQGEVPGAHMRVLEPQHPNSLMSVGNLAECLLDQGQNAEAELLPAALASRIMPALSHRTADRKNPRGRAGAQAAGQQAACAATAAARPLPTGTRVLVQPLFAKPEHNGKRARVLSFDARSGRYAVALDDGNLKELLLKAECVAKPGCTAAGCSSQEESSVCSRCHAVWYCSRECQRADWKSACAVLRAAFTSSAEQ